MNNILIKLKNFMSGRNGVDKLTYGLLILYCIFAAVKIFFRSFPKAYIVMTLLQYVFLGYIVFRVLSRNLQKRYKENFAFEKCLNVLKPHIQHLKLRYTFRKTHCFRTCKNCGEFLRLKKGRGKRKIICPKCKSELNFHILF